MTMGAHTTTPAPVDKDQPPIPHHLPPEAEDRPKAPRSKIAPQDRSPRSSPHVDQHSRRYQKFQWVPKELKRCNLRLSRNLRFISLPDQAIVIILTEETTYKEFVL
jgi:hypothetical protein